jgi:fatty acid desaturase
MILEDTSALDDFTRLRRLVEQAGLLNRQPFYYVCQGLCVLSLLALSVTVLLTVGNVWLQCLNAGFLAFISAQIGLLGHDAGHRQILRTPTQNDALGLLCGNLLLGISRHWWIAKHNRHHRYPNHPGIDPDVTNAAFAATAEQARRQPRILQFMARHGRYFVIPLLLLQAIAVPSSQARAAQDRRQRGIRAFRARHPHWCGLPLLVLQALGLHLDSVRSLARERTGRGAVEMVLIGIHLLVSLSVLVAVLGLAEALLFVLIRQTLFGLYTGSIFAPNHKGMRLIERGDTLDFLRCQVLTARNVAPHPLTDFWYGGLNYQIEHHLFPSMPRNNLRKAQRIVKAYCETHGIAYRETGVLQSYREILAYWGSLSAPRTAERAGA